MKLSQILAVAAAGGFLAADKKPEDLEAAILAADKKPAYDKARDETEEAEDAMGEACDSRAAAMDEAEEKDDKDKAEDKAAKDRKAARDARKGARDARMKARDSRKGARDKRAKDSGNLDPEGTNDNSLANAESGTPAKTGKSEAGTMDAATVDARIKSAVLARDELNAAAREVEPIVGLRAFDSAGDAYKAALETLGVDIEGVPASAYRAMLKLAKDKRTATPHVVTMDSADQAALAAKIPHLNRL